ncbi:hypothetical protein [Stutzerimonas zhaodongensis]|jgi:hypothetical protein|uniref:Uncharacterized protein n=1 Tax=Stutzerimonas zhaodongensis TaxID=1176257 RepID=A0A365PWQ7_9GAMM|nr:hypothetical protein [Stutzerimonas zhaodongensis]QWV17610.1 hypothetical protein KQ248_02600 [Stutzerimonas zhaodongensis]RBA60262.1 hypothetical protein DQ403_05985 [Stutzerimonas zhaodongensis]
MRGTDSENDRHSTAANDPLPRLRRRFFGSLVLLGLLFGSFLGHVFRPGPAELLRIEPVASGLQLWFNREPELYSQDVEGAVGMLFQSKGSADAGRIEVGSTSAGWRVQTTEKGLLLHFVATRPLVAAWSGEKIDGEWRLLVEVKPR